MKYKNKKGEYIEIIKCPVCKKENDTLYLLFDDFYYVKCRTCGLIFQKVRPVFDSLKSRYSLKYFFYELKNKENFFNLMKLTLNDIKFEKSLIKQFPPPVKFLDIGCATGMLLNYVKKLNLQPFGVEICKPSVDYARKNFKVKVFDKSLEKVKFPDNYFEFIHLSHVIEHVPEPVNFVKEIYRILKPYGYIIITTPRVDSFQAKLFGKNWRSYHRDHIFIFSKDTLIKILSMAGFKIKKVISWGGVPKGYTSNFIKSIIDKTVKFFNKGDVICILGKKE